MMAIAVSIVITFIEIFIYIDRISGLSCEKCAQGYRRPTVNGSSYETCIACDCNQRTYTEPPMCDEDTGICLNCKNGTNGTHCESCSAFVQDCTVCTDTQCGQCLDEYWGIDQDGCKRQYLIGFADRLRKVNMYTNIENSK